MLATRTQASAPELTPKPARPWGRGLRWGVRWGLGSLTALLALLVVIGNAEFRLQFLEGRIRNMLATALPEVSFSADDVFVQVVPWRGQLRLRLAQATMRYDVILGRAVEAKTIRLDLPIWQLWQGQARPSAVQFRGTKLEVKIGEEFVALFLQPDPERSTEEIWGHVFSHDLLAQIEAVLPLEILADLAVEDLSLGFTDATGVQPLFDLHVAALHARLARNVTGQDDSREVEVQGTLTSPAATKTEFFANLRLVPGQSLTADFRTGALVPAHYYAWLRAAGVKTPERLTAPYKLAANLGVDRQAGQRSAGLELSQVQHAQSSLLAVVQIKADTQSQLLELSAEYADLDLRRIGPWTPVPEFFDGLALNVWGGLRFRWDRPADDWRGEFDVTRSRGTLAIPAINLPAAAGAAVGVRDLRVSGVFDDGGLVLNDLTLETGSREQAGPVLQADLAIRSTATDPVMTLNLRSATLNQGDLLFLWPTSLASASRDHIARIVTAGAFSNLNFSSDYTLVTQDDGSTQLVSRDSQLITDFTEAQVQLTTHLPPLMQAKGSLSLEDRVLTVDVGTAHMGQSLLQDGHAVIDFSERGWMTVAVRSPIAGPLAPALQAFAEARLGLEGLQTLPLDRLVGQASGILDFSLGFNPLTVVQERIAHEDVRVDTRLHVTDLQVPNYLLGAGIEAGALLLEINEQGLSGEGQVTLDQIPAQVHIHQTFAPDQPAVLEIESHLVVPASTVGRFLPGFETYVTGTARGTAEYRLQRGQAAELRIDLDLAEVGLDFPAFAYDKTTGQAGRLSFDVSLGPEGARQVEGLRLLGPELDVQAEVTLGEGRWRAIRVPVAEIGRTRLRQVSLTHEGDHWRAHSEAGRLDAGALLTQFSEGAEARDGSQGPSGLRLDQPLVVEGATFDALIFDEGSALEDANVSLVLADGGLLGFTVQAAVPPNEPDVPGGRVDARLVRREEAYHLAVDADNFGALLRALDMGDDVREGHLQLRGNSVHPLGGGPWTLSGEVSDLRLLEVPALLNLVATISLTGILEQMSGSGLYVNDLQFQGHLDAPRFTVQRFKLAGPSLGITLSGRLNWALKTLRIRGALAPFNVVNQVISAVPLIGEIFTGNDGEGLFATQFFVSGDAADPEVQVDPLSILQPGIIREIVDDLEEEL